MPAVNESQNNHNDAASDSKKLRLVVSSGQTAEAVKKVLDDAEKHKNDDNYLDSINQAHTKTIPLHNYRGYSIVGDMEPIHQDAECFDDNRPIWFIFPGVHSQCLGAAKDLMHLDVFRNSINRCADVLRPKGIDLLYILTANDETIFDNFINIGVSIVSIQIAFTDLLANLGITPDGIIGISLGEISAAYADGCATLEQTILAAYWFMNCIVSTELPHCALALVALSLEEMLIRIPSDVFIAAHYTNDKLTICGRTEPVAKCVNKLKNEGIYTRNIDQVLPLAIHSELMAEPATKLKKSLEKVFSSPKNRTSRWISTSFPESEWSLPDSQQCSAAYYVKNILSPVLLHHPMQHLPKNAICIEITPAKNIRDFMRKVVNPKMTVLGLNGHDYENNLVSILSTVGELYINSGRFKTSSINFCES